MSTRATHSSDASLYYLTFTCKRWLPLFEICNAYQLVYKWFDYLKEKHGVKITGYIIMPNHHVHSILFFPKEDYDLSKIVGNGKRFIAYDMVKCLQGKGQVNVLLQLKEGLTQRDIANL
jgi:REP element-mobilizing transposase RayT